MSPAARLCGFLVLLGCVFTVAYLTAARLGPVTATHSPSVNAPSMNMGAPAHPGGRG